MPTLPSGNPIALGEIVVTAAGTPEKLTKNFPDAEAGGLMPGALLVNTVFVQARLSNTGRIFVGKRELNVATAVGLITELNPGDSVSFTVMNGVNNYNLLDFRIDAEVSGEKALAAAQVF